MALAAAAGGAEPEQLSSSGVGIGVVARSNIQIRSYGGCNRVVIGSYRGYIRVWFRVYSPPIMENQRKRTWKMKWKLRLHGVL